MTLYYYLDVFYTHFLCFVRFCTCEILLQKKKINKKFKTDLMTSFILLLKCTVVMMLNILSEKTLKDRIFSD